MALLFIDDRLKPARHHHLMQHSQIYGRMQHNTAAWTAITESRYTKVYLIPGLMIKPFFRRFIH